MEAEREEVFKVGIFDDIESAVIFEVIRRKRKGNRRPLDFNM